MPWSLVSTAPQTEQKVAAALAQMELAHRLFMIRCKSVRNGKVIERLAPMFSRYVFVRPENRWRDVREVHGVTRFVKFGGEYATVSDAVIDGLSTASRGDIFSAEATPSRFQPGDKVRINGGVFHAHEGTYGRTLEDCCALVFLEAMGRVVGIRMAEKNIEPVVQQESWRQRKPKSPSRRKRQRQRRNWRGQGWLEGSTIDDRA